MTRLGDDELIARTQRLLREEHKLSARLLVHLAEVDARQLYRQRAYGSMFEYCVQALHLSECEAYLRIGAARLGRRFPRVLRMLASGELHPSALKLLAPVLDDANCDALLDAARCSYVSPDGKRCEQRGWLELHHEDPFARGGQATPDNIRIMCAPHNRLLAERDFGRAFVRQRIELARAGARISVRDVRDEHPD